MTRLKHERRARRLSQARVADATGIHQPVVSLIERGRLVPTAEQLATLATFFNLPSEDLLRDVVIVREVA